MQITPLPPGFGAEISGFDLTRDRAANDVVRLQQAYADHHLLVFRSAATIPPERQVEIAGWFGQVGANSGPDGQPWTVLRNDEPNGSEILPFHADISFVEFPIEGLSLHPVELPDSDTSTSFVSNAAAWDALPAKLQADLRTRKARHYYADAATMGLDWPALEYWHPACLKHRTTGRPMLFVTEHHVDRIEGMEEAEGAEALRQLFALLYAPERRYEHVWRVGDLVIWDNMAIQHARTRVAAMSGGPRALQRVALGAVNVREQLERLRKAYKPESVEAHG